MKQYTWKIEFEDGTQVWGGHFPGRQLARENMEAVCKNLVYDNIVWKMTGMVSEGLVAEEIEFKGG